MLKDKINEIQQIIKYDPYREYVGEWSPKKIQTTYRKIYENPFRPWVFVSVGGLSIKMVIDAIWNEMSYNPLRFGTQNPFAKNDIQSVRQFCKKYDDHNPETKDIMSNIAHKLSSFLYFIGKSNPEFNTNEKIDGSSILIKCNYNRKPNDGYIALSCLVGAIHLIASQNLKDYKIKAFRKQINEIAMSRHPNLQRSRQYLNFINMARIGEKKDSLYDNIMKKTNEISETQARIQTLNDYDPPVDTSDEYRQLARQQSELQSLEEQYENVKIKYDKMVVQQNGIEK